MEDKKVLTEVYEILKHLSDEDFKKIPDDVISLIKENKDNGYIWKYDENVDLEEQKINRNTAIILSFINTEYLLNQKQKKLMEEIHLYNEQKLEDEKRKKYNLNDIFMKEKSNIVNINQNVTDIIEVKKESLFIKILNKIKKFLIK